MKRTFWAILLLLSATTGAWSQGLTGLKFCIDPGHGGHDPANDRLVNPDPGVDFWESESNFQKAVHLKALLEARGAWVILTRTTNDYPNGDEPSLTARWTLANNNNVNWFHSIHSNAAGGVNTSINYTLMLVKENIPTRTAAFPEAVTMSDVIGPSIHNALRTSTTSTWLDYTFYGGPGVGFNLGVLSGLAMPGELSEGSFHDFYPETRRLMNDDYRKMEAYAIRKAFMQYFFAPADTFGIIAGIQTDIAGGAAINQTRVRLLPAGRLYAGDSYNNGFFMFDSLPPGTYTVRFETPGYRPDSVQLAVAPGATVFADRTLESFAAPRVVLSSPADGDTSFTPTMPVDLYFSRVMDTASVRAAFLIAPPVTGTLTWGSGNSNARFTPSSPLPMPVSFVITLDTVAASTGGLRIDGNGDGNPGDPYFLHFRTRVMDVAPPRIITRYPDSGATVASAFHCITITFDEPLNPATVLSSNFAVVKVGGLIQSKTLEYTEVNGRGSVAMYPTAGLAPGASYTVRVSGVKDIAGNAIPPSTPVLWTFSVGAIPRTILTIDSLDASPLQWAVPGSASGTTGLDSATFAAAVAPRYPAVTPNGGAGILQFAWRTSASDWLLRLPPLGSAPAKSVHWTKKGTVLQAYVNGDGGKNQFRFAVEDSVDAFPAGTPVNKEVSPWYTIDWVGWRMVEWDMENDSVGSWVGNRILEGTLRFDGIHLRYVPGLSAPGGRIVLDQIQLAQEVVVGVDKSPGALPKEFALFANYPNPFNPSTAVTYALPEEAVVSLDVYDLLGRHVTSLGTERHPAGNYSVTWNAQGVSSGVYFLRMYVTGERGGVRFVAVNKMMLVR